jgi:hypothetical protein
VWSARRRIVPLVRRPPLPLVFLALYAAAHVLSAAFAPVHRDLARSSLRMVVMAGLALARGGGRARRAGARCWRRWRRRWSWPAGRGGTGIGPSTRSWTFRGTPFNMADRAAPRGRVSNLAAAFMADLLKQPGWPRPGGGRSALLPVAALLSLGLLLTYSAGPWWPPGHRPGRAGARGGGAASRRRWAPSWSCSPARPPLRGRVGSIGCAWPPKAVRVVRRGLRPRVDPGAAATSADDRRAGQQHRPVDVGSDDSSPVLSLVRHRPAQGRGRAPHAATASPGPRP